MQRWLNMRRDGIHVNINLDPETVAQITRFAYSTECYWPTDPSRRFLYANRADAERRCGKAILLGRYFDIEERCEAIRAIAHDPFLHFMAASYMGAPPGQVEARLWWSFVGDATSAERIKADQGFHYDLHDYRSIAFFFHLTDVDEFSGPHVHVRGSHTHKPLRLLLGDTRQSSDEDIVRALRRRQRAHALRPRRLWLRHRSVWISPGRTSPARRPADSSCAFHDQRRWQSRGQERASCHDDGSGPSLMMLTPGRVPSCHSARSSDGSRHRCFGMPSASARR